MDAGRARSQGTWGSEAAEETGEKQRLGRMH